MADDKIKAFYVASTHWDREWYEPFQAFRYHLVTVLDEVLDTMESDERFACFQTDGQSIILEDYLEIRPERDPQVRDYAQQGRLRIGPWYTMPDENLVAPESLIRNLEEGIRVARGFGNVSKVGFVCDIFGHVSQLPQILRGFGIDSAFLFRGVNEDSERGLFRWAGADGSELVAYRFGPREGYFDYGSHIRGAFKHDTPFTLDEALQRLVEYVDVQRKRTGLSVILLFDGGDHMPIEPRTSDLLEGLRKARPDVDVVHTGLDEFAAAIVERRGQISRVRRGELHDPGRNVGDGGWLIPGVLSSRIRLTQDNRAREAELCAWAEPFSHLASDLIGREYPHAYLRRSWRYLLANHAHDSICGCSPDQIHKDMEYRFDQSRLINATLIDEALRAVANRVEIPDLDGEDFALVVFNPTQAAIDGPVDIELWFDEKTKCVYQEFFGYEPKVGFRFFDADGREMPYDYISYSPRRQRSYHPYGKTPCGEECIVVNVTTSLAIPPFGYATITCKPVAEPTRHPGGTIACNDRTLDNEHLCVTVQPNGSLSLRDKRTAQTYDRLLIFEERADIGDGWYHGLAVNDQILTSTACPADVAVVESGALKATLRITNRMSVPGCFEFDKTMRRSEQRETLIIDNYVTLRAGADHVEVRTVVDNNIRDHRIRVLFDSGTNAETYLADSAFDVVERKIGLPPDNHTYKELAVETTPQVGWTAVFDKQRGLAIVAPDLPETAVRDTPERPLALTLLRGFRKTIYTDGEEGGQSLGPHEFRYRLVPLAGEPDRTRLAVLAQRVAAAVHAVQVLPRDQAEADKRTLPPTLGQLALKPGRAVLTAFRRHPEKDCLELRLFNPHEEAITETLNPAGRIASAATVDFEGAELETLSVSENTLTVDLSPKQIVTIHVRSE